MNEIILKTAKINLLSIHRPLLLRYDIFINRLHINSEKEDYAVVVLVV